MSAQSGAGDGTPSTPSTILLVHGFWVTPRSWENWIEHYAKQGYTVLAPAYPGLEVEVEALRDDPSPIAELTIPAILERLEQVIAGLDEEPIIIGHSAGGVFTQLLLDRGHGAAARRPQLGPDRGRQGRAAEPDPLDLRGAEEPGQPPPRRRLHARSSGSTHSGTR